LKICTAAAIHPGLCGMATTEQFMKSCNVPDLTPGPEAITSGAPVAPVGPLLEPSPIASAVPEPEGTGDPVPHDLKGKTARGAFVSTFGQGANFVLRTGSMVILARLLVPADFGLIGMVTACTGFMALFQDAGLSMATIQSASINRAQTSMLFWVNLAVGALLAALCAAMAPILAAFYHEPRLLWVTVILGTGFVLGAAGAQHRATLQRDMRFAVLTFIDIVSLLVSIALAVAMAAAGQRYWALVGMTLSGSVLSLAGVWIAGGWIPQLPRRGAGVRSMLRYGGTLTLNNVICYFAYNADKVLLGRFFGAEVLGIYGRAYTLINLPTQNLNSVIGTVGFPALSRLQNDPARLQSYFLKGYALFLSLVMPITAASALFPEDIIRVFLGEKWGAAAPLFRLLAPTILAFAMINPFGWLMLATGRATRSLKIAVMIAPVLFLGYLAGLPYGATGVAAGFSAATVLLVVPVILWATHGTSISAAETFRAILRPFLSMLIAAGATLAAQPIFSPLAPPILRLVVANAILFGVYGIVLCFVMGQKEVYAGLLRDIKIWPFARRRKSAASVVNVDA
jgi:O-antigen/teichoic acid export membrane protein